MNDRMTHDIKRDWSRFGPDRRLLAAGVRHRLSASSTDADNHLPGTYDVEDRPVGAADCGRRGQLAHRKPDPGSADPVMASSPLRPIPCC